MKDDIQARLEMALRMIKFRERKGLTQEALGKYLGINPTTYCHYERGRSIIPASRIPDFCRALGVTPNELYGWET